MIDPDSENIPDRVSWEDAIHWGFIAAFGGALLYVIILSVWR